MNAGTCTQCGKAREAPPGNKFFPFCSERCRLVDLGRWLGEEYRLPHEPGDADSEIPEGEPEGLA